MSDSVITGRPAVILLVEDNDNDIELTRLSFERARLSVDLRVVRDGEECMDYLRRHGKYATAPMPDLVLLDLNMPRKDGRAVMKEVAADTSLCHLPIVILTTSSEEREVLSLYKLRCSSYIVKPVDFAQFSRVIQSLTTYWFTVVVLPANPPPAST